MITADQTEYLRKRTGEGLKACRKALEAHDGNLEQALEHLRCEGQLVVRRGLYYPCGCPIIPR